MDVWSLGCVFSVVATFVVLGPVGILQYEEARRMVVTQLDRQEHPNVVAQDGFHDGENALPMIRDWHLYLKSSVRKTDKWTEKVLDLVDNCMLLGDPHQRLSARKIRVRLGEIVSKDAAPSSSCPPSIEKILEDIDWEQMDSASSAEKHTNSCRSDSPDVVPSIAPGQSSRSGSRQSFPLTSNRAQPSQSKPRRSRVYELQRSHGRGSRANSVSSTTSSTSRLERRRIAFPDQHLQVSAPRPPRSPVSPSALAGVTEIEDFGPVQNMF